MRRIARFRWRYFGLGLALALIALAGVDSGWGGLAQDQPPCTVTLSPGQSIQAAIDQGSPGDVICLPAGEWHVYRLSIEKSLTLRGAGEGQTKIVGPIYIWPPKRIEVKFEDLTVENRSSEPCIKISGAVLTIRNCTISGEKEDGLLVEGYAIVSLVNSSVSRNGGYGLFIDYYAIVSLVNSTVSGNGGSGLCVDGSASVSLVDSTVSGNGDNGLCVEGYASASLVNSTISGNGDDGLYVGGSASAIIINSDIKDNKDWGIYLYNNGSVAGWGNRLSGNAHDAADRDLQRLTRTLPPDAHTRSKVAVPGDVSTIQQAIDLVADGGTITVGPGTYDGQLEAINLSFVLEGAGKDEVRLSSGEWSRPGLIVFSDTPKEVRVDGLTVEGGGIFVSGRSRLGLANSAVVSGRSGVLVNDYASVSLVNSTVSRNQDGLTVFGFATVSLVNSTVSGSGEDGLYAAGYASVSLRDSTVSGNRAYGISTQYMNQASVNLQNCKVSENGSSGFWLDGGVTVTVANCTVSGNGNDGLAVWGSATVSLGNSTVSRNGGDGLTVGGSADVSLEGNKIFDNAEYGAVLFQQPCHDTDFNFVGALRGKKNEIYDNAEGDVCPSDLQFLMSEEGGCYGPECQGR